MRRKRTRDLRFPKSLRESWAERGRRTRFSAPFPHKNASFTASRAIRPAGRRVYLLIRALRRLSEPPTPPSAPVVRREPRRTRPSRRRPRRIDQRWRKRGFEKMRKENPCCAPCFCLRRMPSAIRIALRTGCVKPERRDEKTEVLGELHEIMLPRLTKRLHLCKIILIG